MECTLRLQHVGNRNEVDMVSYRNNTLRGHTNNAMEIEGEDATYLTVTDVVTEKL